MVGICVSVYVSRCMCQCNAIDVVQELRRRLRYLSHLPLTCEFVMAELDLHPPIISQQVLDILRGKLL